GSLNQNDLRGQPPITGKEPKFLTLLRIVGESVLNEQRAAFDFQPYAVSSQNERTPLSNRASAIHFRDWLLIRGLTLPIFRPFSPKLIVSFIQRVREMLFDVSGLEEFFEAMAWGVYFQISCVTSSGAISLLWIFRGESFFTLFAFDRSKRLSRRRDL